MTSWQPLSVRRGLRVPDEPYEGVPPHLRYPLDGWVRDVFGSRSTTGAKTELMEAVANKLRITLALSAQRIGEQILQALHADDDLYLDGLDLCLWLTGGTDAHILMRILETGGSAWAVTSSGTGLERVVDATTKQAALQAISAGDAASNELSAAWTAVYGRNPDYSDGWDHAIKVVEEVLIPLVLPNQQKANLGGVAGELKSNPSKWSFGLPANGGRGNGETLEGMIRHIWPNPDRHGAGQTRMPTQQETSGALQIAIAIVELCRGKLTKTP